jgi:hypothetical protein
MCNEITSQGKNQTKKNKRESSFNLEYELAQNKIDNYGKSILQIRAMVLAITGILITFYYQKELIESLYITFTIILMFLLIENEHFHQQSKLYKHIYKLERNFNKIDMFRFSLAKSLSSEKYWDIEKLKYLIFNFDFIKARIKLLKSSWFLITILLFIGAKIVHFHFNYHTLDEIDYKIIKINKDYEKTLNNYFDINSELIYIYNKIDVAKSKNNELQEYLTKLKIKEKDILKVIIELKKENKELLLSNKKILKNLSLTREEIKKLMIIKNDLSKEILKLETEGNVSQ